MVENSARTPSARQRKLVEDGAKGVAGRWLGDPEEAAREGKRMRSAVKRFAGKPPEPPEQAEPAANPQATARKRSTRAEQAAAGMMGPPPTTFDEAAIKDWLDQMSAADLAKLARLTAIAKAGKQEGRSTWNKVDRGIAQRGLHVEVHGGTVNIDNSGRGAERQPQMMGRRPDVLGRQLARIKDFING
jgi:hypothetical protein